MIISSFTKTYESNEVLRFPGASIIPGKIYGVVGANGSGKSTFLRILAGTLPADQKVQPFDRSLVRVGYLPQKCYVFHMSAQKNLLLTGNSRSAQEQRRADAMLRRIGLEKLISRKGHTFSGGEAARICLARLLMMPCDLLLLDEPTAALDVASTVCIEDLIREYVQETGAAAIIITHNLKQAMRLCDDVFYFKDGKLEESGNSQDILHHPQSQALKEFIEFS